MKILQPPSWATPKGYANGIAARGTHVFVGGQIGWNASQTFESDDFIAQTRQALLNIRDVLACGALDILQPNAAFCGGLSAMLRILAMAEAHGIPVTGAGGYEAANLPAMAGHAHGGMLEVHGAHAALRTRFSTHPDFRDGSLQVAGVPGLGFSLRD